MIIFNECAILIPALRVVGPACLYIRCVLDPLQRPDASDARNGQVRVTRHRG